MIFLIIQPPQFTLYGINPESQCPLFSNLDLLSVRDFDSQIWIAWRMLLSQPNSRKPLFTLCVCFLVVACVVGSWPTSQIGVVLIGGLQLSYCFSVGHLLWSVLYIELCILLIKGPVARKFENHCCRDLPTPSLPFLTVFLLAESLFYSAVTLDA